MQCNLRIWRGVFQALSLCLLACLILSISGCDSKPRDNGFTWPNQKKERRGSFSSLPNILPIEARFS